MAVGFPTKVTYANGDVFSASDINDTNGTINLLQTSTLSRQSGKNPVINGAFDIWQRGTSFAFNNAGAYTADRWYCSISNTAATVSRQTTSDTTNLPSIQYCARLARNSGTSNTGALIIDQSFETVNSIPFAGQTVTMSFYARKGANFSPSAFEVQLRSGTGTDQNDVNGFTGLVSVANASSISLTTTWTRYSVTGTVPSNSTQLAVRATYVPTGTAGAADYFEITGVQVELGSSATTFSRAGANYSGELALCQRYLPSLIGASNTILGFGKNTSQTYVFYKFPVTARVAPTGITTTTPSTDFFVYNQSGTTGRPSSVAFDFAGTETCVLGTTHTAGSPTIALGQPTMLGISSGSGYILFTGCEL